MSFKLKEIENPFMYDERLYPKELSDLGLERFVFHRELARVKRALKEIRGPLWLIFASREARFEIDFFSLILRYFLPQNSFKFFPTDFRVDFFIQNAYSNALRLVATRLTTEVWRRSFYHFLRNSLEKLEKEGVLLDVLPSAQAIKEKIEEGEEKFDELIFPFEPEEREEELAFALRDFSLKMIERESLGSVVKRLTEATFIWQSWDEGVRQFQNDVFLPHQAKEGLKGFLSLISNFYKPVLMFSGFERLSFLPEEKLAEVSGFLVELESLLYRDCFFIYEVSEENLSRVELLKRGKEIQLSFFPLLDLPLDSLEKAEKMVREQLAPFLPEEASSESLIEGEVVKLAFEKEKDPQRFLTLLGKAWQKAAEEGKERITAEVLKEATL